MVKFGSKKSIKEINNTNLPFNYNSNTHTTTNAKSSTAFILFCLHFMNKVTKILAPDAPIG